MVHCIKYIGIVFFVIAFSCVCFTNDKINPKQAFDPNAIAAAETKMWRAYYTNSPQQLTATLGQLLKTQFHLSPHTAQLVGNDFARASMIFLKIRAGYDRSVLPLLESAYTRIQKETKAAWNPKKAARQELAWWIARRTPGKNSPQNVGKEIAKLYAIIYGKANEHIERAGLIRAQAAALRDRTAPKPDWKKLRAMLTQSYTALIKGITVPDPATPLPAPAAPSRTTDTLIQTSRNPKGCPVFKI